MDAPKGPPGMDSSRLGDAQRKVEEVKSIMTANIQQVASRGEQLDTLVDASDDLHDQAQKFQRQGQALRNKMWWTNMKGKLVAGIIIFTIVIILLGMMCFAGGRNCFTARAQSSVPGSSTVVPVPDGMGGVVVVNDGSLIAPTTPAAPDPSLVGVVGR